MCAFSGEKRKINGTYYPSVPPYGYDYYNNFKDGKLVKNLGPIADMLRPSKEHSTFNQDIRIKEDLDRINQIIKQII